MIGQGTRLIIIGHQIIKFYIDDVINMPYIYVLFYTQKNPSRINYADFDEVDPQTNWLKVTKTGKYEFRKVTDNDIVGGKLLSIVSNSSISQYALYEKDAFLIIRFEVGIKVSATL